MKKGKRTRFTTALIEADRIVYREGTIDCIKGYRYGHTRIYDKIPNTQTFYKSLLTETGEFLKMTSNHILDLFDLYLLIRGRRPIDKVTFYKGHQILLELPAKKDICECCPVTSCPQHMAKLTAQKEKKGRKEGECKC